MRRTNRRLYRVLACVLREESEVEDAIQQAYLSVFLHLDQFAGRSSFATWVTRIALNHAFATRRQRARHRGIAAIEADVDVDVDVDADVADFAGRATGVDADPERSFAAVEVSAAIRDALASLSERDRLVFVLRELEGLSFAVVGESLSISEDAAKMQFHRARTRLGDDLIRRLGASREELMTFGGEHCERVIEATLARVDEAERCLRDPPLYRKPSQG